MTDQEFQASVLSELEANRKFQAEVLKRFEQIDSRFEQIDSRFEQIDSRFDRLERKMDEGFERITNEFQDVRLILQNHETRIRRLEDAA